MNKWVKPIADALLAFGYSVLDSDDSTATLQAGNGASVTLEKLKDSRVTLSTSDDNAWAIRQVADLLLSHPGFVLDTDEDCDCPWVISMKESILESTSHIRKVLLG